MCRGSSKRRRSRSPPHAKQPTTNNLSMSAYTPTIIRDLVDDLDVIFRAAVLDGTIRKVFQKERPTMNTLMQAARDTRDSPEIQQEFKAPRFIWPFTEGWLRAKTQGQLDDQFWTRQVAVLQDFDQEHPDQHRQAGMAPAAVPKAPVRRLQVMVASGPSGRKAPSPAQLTSTAVAREPASGKLKVLVAGSSLAQVVPAVAPTTRHMPSAGSSIPQPARQDKGKGKMVALVEETDDEDDEDDEDEETQEEPRANVRPVAHGGHPEPPCQEKGKQKMVVPVDEMEDTEEGDEEQPQQPTIKVQPPASQGEKKRPAPKTNGRLRTPACRRCVKSKRTCLEQAGFATACVFCATIKMRCDPASEEEEDCEQGTARVIQPAPSRTAAPSKKQSSSKKPAPAKPATSNKPPPRQKPAPAKKVVPAPKSRRAPAAGAKKKVVKSPAMIISSDAETSDAGAANQRPQTQTFADLDWDDDIEHLTSMVTDFRNELVACLQDVNTLEERMDNIRKK
ncbi:hypothetical protein BYT27DRAFT_7263433 [Phlegmacium glaucopus]|nr:hypothetical protein BYT27DRAFT_7263433 [Phlegmacium glaucopus]